MSSVRSPAVFVSHGAPTELMQKGPWQLTMESIGREVSTQAVIVMSAHYRSATGFAVGYCPKFQTIHDFSGFPDELNQFQYPARGQQDFAERCVDLLHGASMDSKLETTRGLDHGVYVPLHHMWPKHNIPVIPIAISSKATAHEVFRCGEILAPLRNEGVMILGSGGLVHNLSKLEWEKPGLSAPEEWAVRFQSWALNVLRLRDFESLCDFKERGPDASVAHPTWEHFAPLLFAAGAASAWGEDMEELYSGWTYGSLSMSAVGFGKIFRDA